MLEEYEKFQLFDKKFKNNLFAEVNWREKDEETNKCKIVKFTLGDKECYIDRKELNMLLFTIGNPEEQKKMIPQKVITSRVYESVLTIEAKSDIKKGEEIRVPVRINLPSVEEEVIAEVGKRLKINKKGEVEKRPSGIVVPHGIKS